MLGHTRERVPDPKCQEYPGWESYPALGRQSLVIGISSHALVQNASWFPLTDTVPDLVNITLGDFRIVNEGL